jgi:xanthine dehydrogenase accessory factor
MTGISNHKIFQSSRSADLGGLEVWEFIRQKLKGGVQVILLWVLESEGSSPGRRGFKMAVASDGDFKGTIGGGIMEHKLVEKAKALLSDNILSISLQRQYHDKQHSRDQSGMICSGSQLIAFVPLFDLAIVNKIISEKSREKTLQLCLNGITINNRSSEQHLGLEYKNEDVWLYSELIDQRPVIHIIGGGHVGLALSELMNFLGFFVKIYDNRPQLNTLHQNNFANEKHVVDYENIGHVIASNKEEYVVIMTFGYRDDKLVFKQLLQKQFYYIGLMGSEAKIQTLLKELAEESISPEEWKHCHIPIGINIFSKTTKEIAVSIAAEIIREKNKNLPTGRSE